MNEETEKKPAWIEFIQARAKCVHMLTEQGLDDQRIAHELSIDSARVPEIRKNRDREGKWRG